MKRENRFLLALAALAVVATPSGAAVSPTRGADVPGESLRQGGYVV